MQYSMDMFGLTKNLYPAENSYTAASTSILDTSTMSWTAIGGYTVAILIVLLIILLFINYTLYPIFQLEPDGPGFIPVPFMKSNEFFWPPQTKPYVVTDFSSCKVNTASLNYGWSMSLDISIMNPTIPNCDIKKTRQGASRSLKKNRLCLIRSDRIGGLI